MPIDRAREPGSERRFVIDAAAAPEGAGRGRAAPRVVFCRTTIAATGVGRGRGAVAASAAETTATAASADLVDLGGGVAQGGTDLVDLELDDRALLTLTGFVGALLEPSAHDDASASGQALGDVLRCFTPDVAAQEERFAVFPLVGVPVEHPRGGRDGEVRDRRTRGGDTQFAVGRQVTDDRDDRVACHVGSSW